MKPFQQKLNLNIMSFTLFVVLFSGPAAAFLRPNQAALARSGALNVRSFISRRGMCVRRLSERYSRVGTFSTQNAVPVMSNARQETFALDFMENLGPILEQLWNCKQGTEDWSHYSKDMVFQDPLQRTVGLASYQSSLSLLKNSSFFGSPKIQVSRNLFNRVVECDSEKVCRSTIQQWRGMTV